FQGGAGNGRGGGEQSGGTAAGKVSLRASPARVPAGPTQPMQLPHWQHPSLLLHLGEPEVLQTLAMEKSHESRRVCFLIKFALRRLTQNRKQAASCPQGISQSFRNSSNPPQW
uniref:Uncharacterized protein n=1 Tax=Melopsittacus undulatus TaxID=13146 RepID=A0A8V5FGV2_MELUD